MRETVSVMRVQESIYKSYVIIAALYCLGFAMLYFWLIDHAFLGWVHLAGFVLAMVSWLVVHSTKNFMLGVSIILFDGTLVVLSLFATGGWELTGYLWPFGYLPYATLLTTRRQARFWIIFLLTGCVAAVVLDVIGLGDVPYNAIALFNFFACYIIFAICISIFKREAEKSELLISTKQDEIIRKNVELATHIKEYQASEQKLTQRTEELHALGKTQEETLDVLAELALEKKKVEEAQAKEEAILTNIGDGVVVVDPAGNVLFMNQQAGLMLHVDHTTAIGQPYHTMTYMEDEHGNIISELQRPFQHVLRTGEKFVGSGWYVRQDETKFPITTTVTPLLHGGKIAGAITIFRDSTHEKEIDQAKNQFVALASHQLRTPTAAIKWYAEMLLHGELGALQSAQQSYLTEIYQSNQRMIELVNALLDVSRIEMGTFSIEPKPITVTAAIDEVLAELQTQIVQKKLQLTRTYAKEAFVITTDPRLLRIVLQNVLANAIDYTPADGHVSVRVELNNQDLKLEIADTGCGIPAAVQSKIFTLFFRADNARTLKPDGTGLGLFITQAVVIALGGKIEFTSEENRGTMFTIILPKITTAKRIGQKQLL